MQDLPTFAEPFCEYSPDSQTFAKLFYETRQTRRHSPNHFAGTRQTREMQVWRVLWGYGKFGKSGKFGECRLDRFIHIKYVICAENDIPYHVHFGKYSRTQVLARLARLADICRAILRVLTGLADFCQTILQDSPDSPTFAKPFCEDSPDSPTFAKGHF
jgi:hypothetical protein